MIIKDYFICYKNDIEHSYVTDAEIKRKSLPLLESILVETKLMKKDEEWCRDAKKVRALLRPRILRYFDEREILIQLVNELFGYFRDTWLPKPKKSKTKKSTQGKSFLRVDDLYDGSEIKYKLLKQLQGGEDAGIKLEREKIAESFGMSRNAMDKHLQDLQNGTQIFGSKVKVNLRYKKNTYDSTIHPVFMALNLSEAYFLTTALPLLAKDSVYQDVAEIIAADVYRQLTPYAKSIIDPHMKQLNVHYPPVNGAYRVEGKNGILFFEKSGKGAGSNMGMN